MRDIPLRKLLAGDVVTAAAGLIGCVLVRRLPAADDSGQRIVRAQIVEAEAYHQRERGCHAFRGCTPRNAVMYGPPGHLYVYFTYGMWHCANVVCEPVGTAAAVLLRAAAVVAGPAAKIAEKIQLRLSGPGLLCQGLQLDRQHNGVDLLGRGGDVWLYRPRNWEAPELSWTTRIGFSSADTLPWRCYWTGHPAVSKAKP